MTEWDARRIISFMAGAAQRVEKDDVHSDDEIAAAREACFAMTNVKPAGAKATALRHRTGHRPCNDADQHRDMVRTAAFHAEED